MLILGLISCKARSKISVSKHKEYNSFKNLKVDLFKYLSYRNDCSLNTSVPKEDLFFQILPTGKNNTFHIIHANHFSGTKQYRDTEFLIQKVNNMHLIVPEKMVSKENTASYKPLKSISFHKTKPKYTASHHDVFTLKIRQKKLVLFINDSDSRIPIRVYFRMNLQQNDTNQHLKSFIWLKEDISRYHLRNQKGQENSHKPVIIGQWDRKKQRFYSEKICSQKELLLAINKKPENYFLSEDFNSYFIIEKEQISKSDLYLFQELQPFHFIQMSKNNCKTHTKTKPKYF